MILVFIYCSDSWMINKICKLMGIVNSNYSLFLFVLLDCVYYLISLCYFGDFKFWENSVMIIVKGKWR